MDFSYQSAADMLARLRKALDGYTPTTQGVIGGAVDGAINPLYLMAMQAGQGDVLNKHVPQMTPRAPISHGASGSWPAPAGMPPVQGLDAGVPPVAPPISGPQTPSPAFQPQPTQPMPPVQPMDMGTGMPHVPLPMARPAFQGPHSVGGAPLGFQGPMSVGGAPLPGMAGVVPQPDNGSDLIQKMFGYLKDKLANGGPSSMGTTYGGDTSMSPYNNTFN